MTQVNRSLHTTRLKQQLIEHTRALMNSLGQLSRSPLATLLTFLVIGIALALPLSLSVALKNIQVISSSFHSTGQINLYLKPNISQEQLHNTMLVLNMNQDIANKQYISPDEGLKEFSQNAGIADSTFDLKQNPLPGVIVVTPTSGLSTAKIQDLVNRLGKLPSVTTAQLDMKWLQRLNAILAIGHRTASVLMILFGIAVLLIIANTIRLTTQNHYKEILVIKLIGGTNRFIQRPFLYSGVLYGLVGAIFAWFIVDIIIDFLHKPITELAGLYNTPYQIKGLGLNTTIDLVAAGILIGLLASWLVVNRYIYSIEPK